LDDARFIAVGFQHGQIIIIVGLIALIFLEDFGFVVALVAILPFTQKTLLLLAPSLFSLKLFTVLLGGLAVALM
jgi:hypothetical protein